MGDAYPRKGGCLRRLIDLRRDADGAAVGWMEDDFHHFGVTIEHDEAKITNVRAASDRFPFTTCPLAGANLTGMIGHALSPRCTDIGSMIPMREQCTHLFDLAGLVMAHAAAGREHRRYEAVILDREIIAWEANNRRLPGRGEAWLLRDGKEVLRWQVDKRMITGRGGWAGQSLIEGFRTRIEGMALEEAEAASVLRRAVMVGAGRTLDPDLYPTARDRGLGGVCYTFLEENRDQAQRVYGSTLNYEKDADGMLARVKDRP